MGWVLEVPPDTMKSTESDAEDGENEHTGVPIAFGLGCVKVRYLCCARMESYGSDDAKNRSEEKGNEGEEDVKGEKEEEEAKKKGEEQREENVEGKEKLIGRLPVPRVIESAQTEVANSRCQLITDAVKGIGDLSRHGVLFFIRGIRFEEVEEKDNGKREGTKEEEGREGQEGEWESERLG